MQRYCCIDACLQHQEGVAFDILLSRMLAIGCRVVYRMSWMQQR
jgi:hypothetical protein